MFKHIHKLGVNVEHMEDRPFHLDCLGVDFWQYGCHL